MTYKYKLGLIAGRFQPFHNGHLHMLKTTLEQCEEVLVLLGSCNNINSEYNPLTYDERVSTIRYALSDLGIWWRRVKFAPLVDIYVGDNPIFGHYIMNTCKFVTGSYPDVLVSGTEPDRDNWIDKTVYPDLQYLKIPRSDVEVSATQVRELMRANNPEWRKLVPTGVINFYEDILKRKLIKND